jgi:asparagine synthetase A
MIKKMSAPDYSDDDDEEDSEVEYHKLEVDLIVESKLCQYPIELKHMNGYDCHTNISTLYDKQDIDEIMTGYALNSNNVWEYHSWGVKGDKIIETTIVKRAYCGYPRFSWLRTL